MRKLTLSAIFASLLAVPFVSAYAEHSVSSDLANFVKAFQVLFKGNAGAFAHHLVQALPVIGLVVVVYGLVYFVAKMTLFRSSGTGEDSNGNEKYAKSLAIGLAILGLAQQGVYNVILNWSRLFIIIIFLISIIAMTVLFYNQWRTHHFKDRKDQLDAKKAFLPVKRETEKLKHDLAMQKKTYGKVDEDLHYLKSELQDIERLSGNEKKQVEKLISLLSRASSAKKIAHRSGDDRGDEQETRNYSAVLSSGIHKLITTLKHEPEHFRHLEATLHDINDKLSHWTDSTEGDLSEVKTDEGLLKKYVHKHHGPDKHVNIKEVHDDDMIIKHLQKLRNHLKELVDIKNTMEREKDEIVKHTFHQKFEEAEAARTDIHQLDYDGAESHLHKLKDYIVNEKHLVEKIRKHDTTLQHILSKINTVENTLKHDLNHLVKDAPHPQ